jgi:chemotaxis protein methyltransferase CheR
MFGGGLNNGGQASTLAHAIVETVREPMMVLDRDLRVLAASRSFYQTFTVTPPATRGKLLYDLGEGDWDIPELRTLMGRIVPERGAIQDCEVEHEFRAIGRRTMRLNARHLVYGKAARSNILLGIEDLTRERLRQTAQDELLRQKDILLCELKHRIGNSLQIIANIMLLKAMSVKSDETRRVLTDAHDRVISVAAVQHCLHSSTPGDSVDLAFYLSELCEAMSQAMVRGRLSIVIEVSQGVRVASAIAESLGLIVAELVVNALKYAFDPQTRNGRITVSYVVDGADWTLAVADNGAGLSTAVVAPGSGGLGSGIIKALAAQLGARVSTASSAAGTTVSIVRSSAQAGVTNW